MRTPIHPDCSLAVPRKKVHVKSDQPLRRRIDFSPNANIAEAAQRVVGCVRAALIFLDDGNTIGIPAVRSHTRSIIDRHLQVVAEFRPGASLGRICVIRGPPFAGKVDWGERGSWSREKKRGEEGDDRGGCGGVKREEENTKAGVCTRIREKKKNLKNARATKRHKIHKWEKLFV